MTVSACEGGRSQPDPVAARLFAGAGEMRARCRAFDWSTTRLGPVSGWSQSLRTTVATMMAARHPMFLWWGPDLVQIFNDGYLPSLGESERERAALGARGREFWADIWPAIGFQIDAVMAHGEATWHEDHLVPITRNGRVEDVWWTYGYSPVRDDDWSVGGVLVVVQETTARVRALAEQEARRAQAEMARARLGELFRKAPAFIAVLRGPQLMFELANDAYYQLVGHRDIVGKPVFEALPDARGQGFEELLKGVLDTGQPFVGKEVRVNLQRTAGAPPEQRYIDFVYAPITEADSSRSGVFVHGVDVTDEVRSRRAVEELNRQLRENAAQLAERTAEAEAARAAAERANRAKSEFLAVMSHELRTPLNAISGYAELMELGIHGPVTPEQAKALARIQESERHLLGLVNGVLNYSRVEAGAMQYSIEEVPLHEVLVTCEALMAPQVRAKGQTLRYDGTRRLTARADREKVQQIVLNLLSNAVKFTEPGGSIALDCAMRADGKVTISVSDTGRGIAAELLESVFQPFVQVDSTLTRTHEGTGLGLAISRDLARGMGGDLTVESTPGRGSTFTIVIKGSESLNRE
jgi:signal transduction histidine kinase